ncbi:MAG: T9SS type A sorting domain-containing protein [Saprospiraceae bacterium]|nr:T9SS type A sorting domain-containing protein [Saprospiraceae bacterium]
MQKKFTSFSFLLLFIANIAIAQKWTHHYADFEITCSFLDKDNGKWFGTYGFGVQHVDESGNIKNYNTSNSEIAHNFVNCITQDSLGRIWIGTNNGISILHNSKWTQYNSSNTPLSNNKIGLIKFDKNYPTLICHFDSSFTTFDGTNWNTVKLPQTRKRTINDLAYDNNGIIWIASTNGIIKYDGQKYTGFYTDTNTTSFQHDFIEMEKDLLGNIYATGFEGFFTLEATSWKVIERYPPARSMYIDSKNRKWFFSGNEIHQFDGTNFVKTDISSLNLDLNSIKTILVDKNNSIWVATKRNGVGIYSQSLWYFLSFANSGLIDNHTTDLKFADPNNLWIATDYGICQFNNGNWNKYDSINKIIDYPQLRRIAIGEDKNIWLPVYNKGLVQYDQTNWKIHNKANSGFPSDYTFTVYIDKKQRVWTNPLSKFYFYENKSWNNFDISTNDFLVRNSMYSMIQRANNELWFQNLYGISIFDGVSWRTLDAAPNLPNISFLTDITEDIDQNVWISGSGVAKLNGTTWTTYNSTNSPLPNDRHNTIYSSKNSGIWIGSTYGFYNFHNNVWKTQKDFNFPFETEVFRFNEDSKGNLWVATRMGIFVLDRSTVASDDKIQTKEIEFNPNPVQSNINFETEISSYKIFDLNGNAIQENTKHTSNSIDVSKLLTGMYFIQINSGTGTQTIKFIKE